MSITILVVAVLFALVIGVMIGYATAALMFISAEVDRRQNRKG